MKLLTAIIAAAGCLLTALLLATDAMPAGTETADNTLLGVGAGSNLTSGSANTLIGVNAGNALTTGFNNTFVGDRAGEANTAAGNSFFGFRAGTSHTSGTGNTFLGDDAGLSHISGFSNTFVGAGAGAFTNSGSNNTFVGMDAGINNTQGENNVFLGYHAGFYEPGSNKLYIEPTDSAAPLIYGEFDNDVVVINGDFSAGSSREIKHAFAPVAPRKVLEHLLDLPIAEWSFRAGDPETRHIGPTSEDFHAAFDIGRDDKHISPLDLAGVALAAIQGLKAEKDQELAASKEQTNAKIALRDAEIKMLKEELTQLRELVNRLVANDHLGSVN